MLNKATVPFLSLSALGIFGNAYVAYSAQHGRLMADSRVFALAALFHVADVVYSINRLGKLNKKLLDVNKGGDKLVAVSAVRDWAQANWRRVYLLVGAGIAGLSQSVRLL